jgi:alanine racemase
MYRHTYAKINTKAIYNNITKIKNTYDYKYYIAVVKANCYGHGINSIQSMIDAGCNYLAVATLEEALEIRNRFKDIPILCLELIFPKDLKICIDNNITITINSLDYYNQIKDLNYPLKVHIKLNTGMNRLGINRKIELNEIYTSLKNSNYIIEGIYTHIFNSDDENDTNKQFNEFYELCNDIDLNSIDIVHIAASSTLTKYIKTKYINGVRLGIIMYGFSDELELESTFSLHSKIIQINEIDINDKLGYNGDYIPSKKEIIGVIQIGYADGVIREYKGNYVYINNNKYEIIGNICMDMLFVKLDHTISLYDEVTLLKDNVHIMQTSTHLNTIPYEVMCNISDRVTRIY